MMCTNKKEKKMNTVLSFDVYKASKECNSNVTSIYEGCLSKENIQEIVELETNHSSPEEFDEIWFNKGDKK